VVTITTIIVLVIFTVINITREEVLKHGQPYSSTSIRHGSGMA
jgi:hypothetical protein